MKEQRRAMWVLLAIVGGAVLSSFGENFPLGTYIYAGSVMNYKHEVCTSADRLTVQAVAADGTVLASGKVVDPAASSGVNYRLEVPVSTEASAKSAVIGDELNCVILSAGGTTNVSTRALPPVARANAIARVDLVNASSTAFDDGKGGSLLVANDYLEGIAPYMEYYGKDSYDPTADWDGDGISNYGEYKAGTNPFDPSDRLRITDFKVGTDDYLITFEYAGGHLYAVDSTPSLTNKAWKAASFRPDSAAKSEQKEIWFPGNESEDIGTTTLYLAPAAGSPSMFYTIRAE